MGYQERSGKLYELPPNEVSRQRGNIGMVFQNFNLFPQMTALENIIEAPIGVKKVARDEAITDATRLLSEVGLQHGSKNASRSSDRLICLM